MFRPISRRVVVLAVAYAVALNLLVPLLTALAPAAQAATATLAELCATDQGAATSGDDRKGRHEPMCPLGSACLMQGCGRGGLLALGPQTVAAFAFDSTAVLLSIRLDGERFLLRAIGARFARAPPQS
jgi:hypothetical protein